MKKVKIWLKSGNIVEFETDAEVTDVGNKIRFITQKECFAADCDSIEAMQITEIQPLTKL